MTIDTTKLRFFCAIVTGLTLTATASEPRLQLLGRTKFLATPGKGIRVNAAAFYTQKDGLHLASWHNLQSRSDTADIAYRRLSADNGRSWSKPITFQTQKQTAQGVLRTYPRIGYVDPNQNVLIEFWLEGVLPSDDPLEGMKHWHLRYTLSRDGGRSSYHDGPVIHQGDGYSPSHPFPGVQIGKNSMMIGDQSCTPITLKNGTLLQPVQITPTGPDGEYHNPGGGYTYHDAAVLIGKWNDDGILDWSLSDRVVGDPSRSTRGMLEPTLAQFPDGRVLMVLRGSNHRNPEIQSYKWYCISDDQGHSWSKPRPWTYEDGNAFFSPSSCSQLLRHSSGHIFWIGNICNKNPNGNLPRHPLVIAEVNRRSMLLSRKLCVVDQRRSGDSDKLQLSNFFAREDRQTQDILVHCSPLNRTLAYGSDGKPLRVNWTADAWLYRIKVTSE